MGENARCSGETGGKVGPKLESSHFPGESGTIDPIRRLGPYFTPSQITYLKYPRKYQKPIILTFFTLAQICTSPLPNFGENPEFDYTPLIEV